jgi:transposase
MMECIGIDAHKSSCTVKVLDTKGGLKEKWIFPTTRTGIQEFIKRAPKGIPVAIEASTSGKAVARVLQEHNVDIHMGVPAKLAMITQSDVKTDDRDSVNLAHLLQAGYFPECYIPTNEIEDHRNMIRNRMQIGKKISAVKNQVHTLIARNLLVHEFKGSTDVFGVEGMETLSEIELPSNEKKVLARHMMELKILLNQEEEMQREMAKIGQDNEDVKLLMTIPGIDYYTAIALIAEIGDIKRFPTKRHLCSYSGVVPKARNSGDVVSQHQRVKHGNNVLKYFLTNAVQGILKTKKNTAIKIFYRKKEKQIGAPKAQVAAARKLASVVWWVLTNKKPYVDEDPVLTKRKHKNMNAKAIKAEKEISQEDIKKLIGEIEQKRDVLDRIIHDVENG